jgi:putative adenylate-forming enzyme
MGGAVTRSPSHLWTFLAAFLQHRWGFRFRSRAALEAFQQRQLRKLLRRATRASFFEDRGATDLQALPITDKPTMLSAFAAFNTAGVTLEQARHVALEAEATRDFSTTLPQGLTVGSSSGTSGRSSLFLVSSHERAQWAGAVLGRMLSSTSLARIINPFARPLRIAFFLRANSNLYTTLNSWRIRFQFFDLVKPVDSHLPSLQAFRPDILVAPASVLRRIAESQQRRLLFLDPGQVVNVAECLEPDDADAIAAAFGRQVQQIYQCTEGVLGFSCAAGCIHLNEECVYIEPQWLDEGHSRFTALVTDFSRATQMFIRFRMDDVLHVDPLPCRCGRVTVRLSSIEGRADDVLVLPNRRSAADLTPIFPDQIRRAVMVAAPDCPDYQIEQHGLSLTLSTAGERMSDLTAIRAALGNLFDSLDVQVSAVEPVEWCPIPSGQKRRRIRCISPPHNLARSA